MQVTTTPTTPPAEGSSGAQLHAGDLEPAATESPSVKRIRDAQRILDVTITGKMGKPTRDALAAYQLAAGLPVSGDLTAQTWKALHR